MTENPFHLFARYAEALNREFKSELEILSARDECVGIASKLASFNLAVVLQPAFTPPRERKKNGERVLEFEVAFELLLVYRAPENQPTVGRAKAISKIRISENTEDAPPDPKLSITDKEFLRSLGMQLPDDKTPAS